MQRKVRSWRREYELSGYTRALALGPARTCVQCSWPYALRAPALFGVARLHRLMLRHQAARAPLSAAVFSRALLRGAGSVLLVRELLSPPAHRVDATRRVDPGAASPVAHLALTAVELCASTRLTDCCEGTSLWKVNGN